MAPGNDLNYKTHNPQSPPVFCVQEVRAVVPIFPFGLRALDSKVVKKGESGSTAISSAFCLCVLRRTSSSGMLGQSIRRFTTSVVRRSHYEEGPGKVSEARLLRGRVTLGATRLSRPA